jgi:hypothetical protein
MDPAGAGALIGICILVGFGISLKLYDYYKERKKLQNLPTIKSPLLVRRHSKINTLLPK